MAVSNSVFFKIFTFKSLNSSKNIAPHALRKLTNRMNNINLYSTATATSKSESQVAPERVQRKMSKAMLAYLERSKAHDVFIQREKENYNIGKRHLANMMGEDPELFTQADVDKAIEYLLPSGLFDKAARPVMKPPEEIFPPKPAAAFDETGRPFHSMFYTTRPNYFETLYNIVEEMQKLKAIEDEMIRKGIAPDPNNTLDLTASGWMSNLELNNFLLEEIQEKDYEYFIATIQRLSDHPYSYLAKDTIMKYRKIKVSLTQSFNVPKVEVDSDGRPFVTVSDCMRKSARGSVTIKGKGTGIITVNGKPVSIYFTRRQDIEQVRL